MSRPSCLAALTPPALLAVVVGAGCSSPAMGGVAAEGDAAVVTDGSGATEGGSPRADGGGAGDDSATDGGSLAEGGTAPGADGGGCGPFAGDTQPTCSGDGNSLGQCVAGVPSVQACANGCLHAYGSQPAACMGTVATNFSCTGSYGKTPVDDGNYYITSFGCYVDSSGNVHTDPDDNCIPSCLSQARSAGLCPAGSSGPACEEAITWYTADAARFGCLARLRVTNPATGKAVIAVALDYGPGCSGENSVAHAVLDSSGRIDDYLFGGPEGASDRALVHVVQVDDQTPLGPI